MTRMTLIPRERGSAITKSIVASSHTAAGIGKGCNKHAGTSVELLICWHIVY